MLRVYFFLFVLSFSLNSHGAVDEKSIAKCSSIKGDLERLECFDDLSLRNGLNGPKTNSLKLENIGDWRLNETVNPVDDSKTTSIYLPADTGRSKRGKAISLIVRCRSNKTEMMIDWEDYLGINKTAVLIRVGDQKAKTEDWILSTDNTATFRNAPIGLLKEMFKSEKFLAQVTPYSSNPVTAIFKTSVLENAIKPLRKNCNW